MSEQALNQSEIESSPPQFPLGPGSILKQAREACGFTQADVANRLHISVQRIQEIEENDFSQMKAVIYAQGYLRTYADMVKLPVESVLESFKSLEWTRQEQAAISKDKSDKWIIRFLPLNAKAVSRVWVYITTSLILTAVVFGVVMSYLSRESLDEPNVQAMTTVAAPSVSTPSLDSSTVVEAANKPNIAVKTSNEAETENPFVQPLAPPANAVVTPKKAPIVEAQPVISHEANQ